MQGELHIIELFAQLCGELPVFRLLCGDLASIAQVVVELRRSEPMGVGFGHMDCQDVAFGFQFGAKSSEPLCVGWARVG